MGLFGWLAAIWLASKILPGMAADTTAPKLGGATNKADGSVVRVPGAEPLLACAGKWWAISENGVCCQGASGTAVTLSDGEQVVCAFMDELSSYRWVKPGSQ